MTTVQTTGNGSQGSFFGNLGRSFQEKVIQALLTDRIWATSFIEVFNLDECVEPVYLKLVASKYLNYYTNYKEFPTLELLLTIIKDDLSNGADLVLRQQCHEFLQKVVRNENGNDLPWVKDKAFTFCRQQMLKKALSKSVDIILTDKYETVVDIMKDAIAAGVASSPGHDYNNDIDVRYSVTFRHPIRTGMPELDDKRVMAGGLGAGEIGIVVAPSGVGKSHLLTHFGAQALSEGKNVFHYTMELNERYVGIRYDSNLTGINSSDCAEATDLIKEYFEAHKDKLGRLIIKEFPARSITCNTIKAHVEKMSYKGVKPDLILIDYAGIIRSTERYELPRLEMQYVIQEIRKLGKELDVPVWTALQSNKDGAKSDIVDLTNMAESYGQAAEADFVLGLQRMSTQKATGYGTLFVAKNRFGVDGLQFKVHLDTARSKIKVLTAEEVEGMQLEQESERQTLQDKTLQSFRDTIRKSKESFQVTKLTPARHAT
jgi:replicative DNA helicase